jgi:uncharacterized damage-inducible protein DinB
MARETRTLEPMADEPEVGRWLAAMADARRDTLRELEGVTDPDLDVLPPGADNSLGSLLYHLALIEADWLVDEILGLSDEEFEQSALARWFPESDRDGEGHLTGLPGETLAGHRQRLAAVRDALIDEFRSLSVEDFHEPRARARYDVSPAWVLHHLLQHEAEHRGEIGRVRRQIGTG